jgi:hypothetical protein
LKFLDSEGDCILGDCNNDLAESLFGDYYSDRKHRKNSDNIDVKPALIITNNKLLDKTNGLPSKGSLKDTSASDAEENKLLKLKPQSAELIIWTVQCIKN